LSTLLLALTGLLLLIAALRHAGTANRVSWLLFWWPYRRLLAALLALAGLFHLAGL